MRKLSSIITALALGSMVAAVPIEVDARPFPKGIKKPQKTREFRQIKNELRSFQGRGRTAYNNFKAAYRSERMNRQLLERAQNGVNRAQNAYNADRSPQNNAAVTNAQAQLSSVQGQYNNALSAYRGAKANVGALRDIRNNAINAQRQQQGIQPRPARQARPQFSANARVQQRSIGVSVAPNVNAALNNGRRAIYAGYDSVPPLRRNEYQVLRNSQMFPGDDGGFVVPGPPNQMYGQQIVANPAAFPTALLQQSAPANAQQSQIYESPFSPLN